MARAIKQQGFTLIELLIAIVILMALMFTANYSYALYSQYWHGRIGSFDETIFHYQGLLQVKETIDSSIPYVVKNGGSNDHTFYFLGREDGMTLVTNAPIFAKTVNDAAVVRIFSEPTDDGHQLVYEEAPLNQNLLIDLNQQLNFSYRLILMRTDEAIRFSYYGWDSIDQKKQNIKSMQVLPTWRGAYDAATTRVQPEKLRLNFEGVEMEFNLPQGHTALLDFYIQDSL